MIPKEPQGGPAGSRAAPLRRGLIGGEDRVMRSELLWFLPRPEEPPEPAADEPGFFDIGDHDPVVRYATLGIFVILATAALAIARPVALPVTAGIVFGLVLGPVADLLVRRGWPHAAAAGVVVIAGLLLLIALFAVLAAPVALGADQIPAIVDTLRAKFDGFFDMMRRLQGVPDNATRPVATETAAGSSFTPLLNIAVTSTSAAGGLLIFVATIFFYLAARRQLKARILRLCLGRDARQVAGSFFEEVETRIGSYFAVVTIINLGMGVVTGIIAWLAGFPYPLFWGALAFLLNYLPFIGPLIVAALMVGAGITLTDNAAWAIAPGAAYVVIHVIEGNLLTPSLVGQRLTVSPFLVFLSFVFWLWLWGPAGAILSTPLLLVGIVMVEVLRSYRIAHEIAAAEASDAAAGTATPAASFTVRSDSSASTPTSVTA
jgi:predicted PurR-regulated permease PerM